MKRRVNRQTVFDEADVADDELGDRDLGDLRVAERREAMLVLDLALKSAELALLLPVVERRHYHHDDDGEQDRRTLDPPGLRVHLVRRSVVVCIRVGNLCCNFRLDFQLAA